MFGWEGEGDDFGGAWVFSSFAHHLGVILESLRIGEKMGEEEGLR